MSSGAEASGCQERKLLSNRLRRNSRKVSGFSRIPLFKKEPRLLSLDTDFKSGAFFLICGDLGSTNRPFQRSRHRPAPVSPSCRSPGSGHRGYTGEDTLPHTRCSSPPAWRHRQDLKFLRGRKEDANKHHPSITASRWESPVPLNT